MENINKENVIIFNNTANKKIRLDKYLSFCFEYNKIVLNSLINKKYNEFKRYTNIEKLEDKLKKLNELKEKELINNDEIKVLENLEELITEYNQYISRSKVQKLIENNEILVNNNVVSASYSLKEGDEILVNIDIKENLEINEELINNFKTWIIFENDDILVINKPKGLIVHSGVNTEVTLEKIILKYYENTNTILPGEKGRKGIVHRLDKDTSGLMVIAKNEISFKNLVMQFKERLTKKKYRAITRGEVNKDSGTINMPIMRDNKNRHKMMVDINGKTAITNFEVIKKSSKYTYLDVEILTGRTHQIRVHLANIGYPVLGDYIYSNGKNEFNITGQVLQSYYLEIYNPTYTKSSIKENIINNEENINIEDKIKEKKIIKIKDKNKNSGDQFKFVFVIPESEEIVRIINEF